MTEPESDPVQGETATEVATLGMRQNVSEWLAGDLV